MSEMFVIDIDEETAERGVGIGWFKRVYELTPLGKEHLESYCTKVIEKAEKEESEKCGNPTAMRDTDGA